MLCLERPLDQPFGLGEIEALRLAADLVAPRLVAMQRQDKWVGARAAGGVRKAFSAVVGPKHTWIKVAGIAICAAIVFLVFAKGDYRADAPFVLEPIAQQVLPAPFEGYLKEVYVRPGDLVVGASLHVGDDDRPSWLLTESAVTDWPTLLLVLRGHDADHPGHDEEEPTPTDFIASQLSPAVRKRSWPARPTIPSIPSSAETPSRTPGSGKRSSTG